MSPVALSACDLQRGADAQRRDRLIGAGRGAGAIGAAARTASRGDPPIRNSTRDEAAGQSEIRPTARRFGSNSDTATHLTNAAEGSAGG